MYSRLKCLALQVELPRLTPEVQNGVEALIYRLDDLVGNCGFNESEQSREVTLKAARMMRTPEVLVQMQMLLNEVAELKKEITTLKAAAK